MSDPKRAERLWLAIAIATLYLVSVGGQQEDTNLSASSLHRVLQTSTTSSDIPTPSPTIPTKPNSNTVEFGSNSSFPVESIVVRSLSCFRRGYITILATLLKGHPIPIGQFIPDFSPAPG